MTRINIFVYTQSRLGSYFEAFFKSVWIISILWWAPKFSPVHMIAGPECVVSGARLYFHAEMFKGPKIVYEPAVLPAPHLDVLKGQ